LRNTRFIQRRSSKERRRKDQRKRSNLNQAVKIKDYRLSFSLFSFLILISFDLFFIFLFLELWG